MSKPISSRPSAMVEVRERVARMTPDAVQAAVEKAEQLQALQTRRALPRCFACFSVPLGSGSDCDVCKTFAAAQEQAK